MRGGGTCWGREAGSGIPSSPWGACEGIQGTLETEGGSDRESERTGDVGASWPGSDGRGFEFQWARESCSLLCSWMLKKMRMRKRRSRRKAMMSDVERNKSWILRTHVSESRVMTLTRWTVVPAESLY